jgi:hypothetical protein
MIFDIKVVVIMGCGQSHFVENQEVFVEQKFNRAKSGLPQNKYTDNQIRAKLRQEYSYRLSNRKNNSDNYISRDDWKKILV